MICCASSVTIVVLCAYKLYDWHDVNIKVSFTSNQLKLMPIYTLVLHCADLKHLIIATDTVTVWVI